mmetsp:Transcript_20923/g.66736  ORF Transcript_20923/g.66736 Transcript_20923/m.66736 type:complete len:210 (+) Transcript_20923:228-857(+)
MAREELPDCSNARYSGVLWKPSMPTCRQPCACSRMVASYGVKSRLRKVLTLWVLTLKGPLPTRWRIGLASLSTKLSTRSMALGSLRVGGLKPRGLNVLASRRDQKMRLTLWLWSAKRLSGASGFSSARRCARATSRTSTTPKWRSGMRTISRASRRRGIMWLVAEPLVSGGPMMREGLSTTSSKTGLPSARRSSTKSHAARSPSALDLA